MGGSPEVPKPTDPLVTANKQQEMNTKSGQQSQAGSMVNQVNPWGNLTYMQSGTSPDGTPLYTSTTTLSPENQKLLQTLQGTQALTGQQGFNLLQGANYGSAQPGDVIGNSTKGLVKDAMANQIAYLQPQMDYDIDRLDTRLKNMGFNPGEPGYDKQMNALKQSHGQQVQGYLSQIEPQMWNQSVQQYMMPLQMGGQLSGFGSPTAPTFGQTPQLSIQPANLVGATANANDAQMKAYEAEQKQNSAMMSGMFGIPTAVLGGWAGSGAGSAALTAGMAAL